MRRMEGLFGGLSRRIRQRWSSSRLASTDRVGGRRRNGLKSFLRDQNGAVAAMVAVSLTVILGFGALTIDMSYAYSTRNLLQVTASSAALAAAPELPNQSQVVAKALEYVEANMPAANHGTVLDNSDVVPGNWDPDTKTWTPGASSSRRTHTRPAHRLRCPASRGASRGSRYCWHGWARRTPHR